MLRASRKLRDSIHSADYDERAYDTWILPQRWWQRARYRIVVGWSDRDGRVLVSDSRDKTLQLIDLFRGAAQPIGRLGAGPGEWASPSRLYALPGDSTLMADFSNNRYFLIDPATKKNMTQNWFTQVWANLVYC